MLGPHVPSLADLDMLVAIGELGSLGRVAQRLGVSQQAVSLRVRAMERQVGAPLVERSARGSRLTQTGRIVAGWAAEVLAAAARLDAGISSLRSETARHLDVAASLTIAEYLLPRWLIALRESQEAPGRVTTDVGLSAVNSEAVLALVRAGTVPLGFIETPEVPTDLRTLAIGHDTLRVAVAPAHPWARLGRPVTAAELAATPLITREEGSGTRRALEFFLAEASRTSGRPLTLAPPRLELSSTASVRTAIVTGVAPGVLSSLALADDLALGRLVTVEVTGIDLTRTLHAVWRTGDTPPPGPARDLVAIAAKG